MIETLEEFLTLWNRFEPDDRQRLRHDPLEKDLWDIVLTKYPECKEAIALHKAAPCDTLHKLATDPDSRVRWFVAIRRKLRRDTFELLAKDKDESVRIRVAYNPKVPMDILESLASEDDYVGETAREVIAGKKS